MEAASTLAARRGRPSGRDGITHHGAPLSPQGHGAGVPSITRFRTAGELVGEAALITHAATRCLTRTAATPLRRHALLCSLEDRNRSDEAVYAMAIRPPLERVSRLLAHLADTAGIPDPDTAGHIVITGPGQKDIAAALQLAVSTTENAHRTLRHHGVIEARYRQFVVRDVDALRHFVGA